MRKSEALSKLTDEQLGMVETAVEKWITVNEPGIFGYISETDIKQISMGAIEAYKEGYRKAFIRTAIPAALISAMVFGAMIFAYEYLKKKQKKTE